MLTIGIVGLGLTGSAIARYLIEQRPDLPIVLAGAGPQSAKAGKDLGAFLGLDHCGVPILTAEAVPAALYRLSPEVVIDFSRPEATTALLRHYARAGCGVVVGTTGFSESQLHQLRLAAGTGRFGLMYAPNITRGVNVLMLLAKLAAHYLPGYDIEIIERHHRKKRDAPSGTAGKIADQLHDTLESAGQTCFGRYGAGLRASGEIGVHAIRAGGIVGMHEVLFANDFDEVVITHRSESRLAFASGAVEAAVWMAGRRGFYTMEEMIQSSEVEDFIPAEASLPAPTGTYA
ncbi:MAG TPA: 4-hydroxy-tetrahydrodipicolinate reductase [Armatimonadota bacterium]|jgi:4-hydroxy-tetrahydrodipicolinate reductase